MSIFLKDMNSPLLFPVRLEDNRILVLDETELPFKEVYIEIKSFSEAKEVLAKMKTRAWGQVLLYLYSAHLWKEILTLEDIAGEFHRIRPTFDFFMLAEILKKRLESSKDIKSAVDSFINEFDQKRKSRAWRLAKLLPSLANILTICNINGELIYLYEALVKLSKKPTFFVCETRPYLQGSRLTFWELQRENIPSYLICDSQSAILMKEGKVNCVVVGADRVSKTGDIINKIGTYSLAALANYFGIPFYALVQYPRDIDINKIEIEERPSREVFMFLDNNFKERIDAIYPAFDITPQELITQCIHLSEDIDYG